MKRQLVDAVGRLAPRTLESLRELEEVRERYGSLQAALAATDAERLARLEAENAALREEIDELRSQGRYVAELYDLVIERVRADAMAAAENGG
jgi:cell division protein FtsB